ncbi:MAG: cation:dicarboxylase symporter family transporter [Gemmatimonadales bacterium]|nr:cation:dicarboxylase symporter family transporter [Gemmatimonadales bacterium]
MGSSFALAWHEAHHQIKIQEVEGIGDATTSIATAERELGVQSKIAGFVLPLAATMNMNGTALFEGVTVLFLAQVFGVHLDLGAQVFVVVLSVMTAIGCGGCSGGIASMLHR